MQQEIDINTSEKYNQEMMKNLFNTLKNISPINKEYEYLLKVPHVDNASIGNGICTYASVSSLINYIARLNGKEFLTATKFYEKYDHEK